MDSSIKHITRDNKPKRKIKIGDKEIEVRIVKPSEDAIKALGARTQRQVVGHLPVNPPHLERLHANRKARIMREMALMNNTQRLLFIKKGPIDFVSDKTDYHKYKITCTTCEEPVATVWAKDETLSQWCDLHYISRHDEYSWYGCMSVNVSPLDGKLGFECACGEDTRDFRANKELPPIQKQLMSEYSTKHRDFASPNSKYIAMEVK